jgi:hypothetical protein
VTRASANGGADVFEVPEHDPAFDPPMRLTLLVRKNRPRLPDALSDQLKRVIVRCRDLREDSATATYAPGVGHVFVHFLDKLIEPALARSGKRGRTPGSSGTFVSLEFVSECEAACW